MVAWLTVLIYSNSLGSTIWSQFIYIYSYSFCPRWRWNPEIAQYPERSDTNSMHSANVQHTELKLLKSFYSKQSSPMASASHTCEIKQKICHVKCTNVKERCVSKPFFFSKNTVFVKNVLFISLLLSIFQTTNVMVLTQ